MSGIVFRTSRARKHVDLNITPMIDVLFLLLIFFSLTSTFRRAGELELQLPESTTAGSTGSGVAKEPVDLVLTETGLLLLDGSPATFETLLPRLRSLHDRQPDRQARVEAEEGVTHGQVVRLLDAVRTAGFTGVGIGVRVAESGSPNRKR